VIIVMSDLHFADSSSLSIGEHYFNHNLPPEVYRAFSMKFSNLFAMKISKTLTWF